MREVLSTFLSQKAVTDDNFHLLTGDHGYALFDRLRKTAPHKFINTGVAEQGMVGIAAGMAKAGKRVAIYGLSSFIPIRVVEFLKVSVLLENLPVILLGDGAGLVYSTLGPSHQCLEDLAILRTLPIDIYSPADAFEMKACLDKAYENKKPAYIRIGKSDRVPSLDYERTDTKGPLIKIYDVDSKVALVATGSMVSTAAEIAKTEKFDVFSAPYLSQFDKDFSNDLLSNYECIFSLEEHSISGGFGDLLRDVLYSHQLHHIPFSKIGATKSFTERCGSYDYALSDHKLDLESVRKRILRELKR